jgi:hypothetical protein
MSTFPVSCLTMLESNYSGSMNVAMVSPWEGVLGESSENTHNNYHPDL